MKYTAAQLAHGLDLPEPTPEQARVIESGLDPLLVVAGAGSGKTETMAARVVYLIANEMAPPDAILGLTFTRKAAAELSTRIRARLTQLSRAGLGPELRLGDQPRISTYHSYAASLVTDHGLRLAVDPDAVLIGDAARFQLAEQIVRTWPGDVQTDYAASTVVEAVTMLASELAEHALEPAQAAQQLREIAQDFTDLSGRMIKAVSDVAESLHLRARLMELVAAFDERKREEGVVDFADHVRLAGQITEQVPAVSALERSRYRVVLLDEYQDTSVAQVALLRNLFGGGHPVTAVGDPNQAIYGWRGAAAGTLLAFPEQFPARSGSERSGSERSQPAAIAPLSVAWRNDTAILDAANAVAAPLRSGEAAAMVPKLRHRDNAGTGVVLARRAQTIEDEAEQIAALLGEHWSGDPDAPVSAAVLCRKRSQFAGIESALTAAGLPAQVVGLGGLLLTPEVCDVRSALTVAHDPSRGDAMMRLLTGPSVQLGAADLAVLSQWSRRQARPARKSDDDQKSGDQQGTDQVLEADEQASLVEALDVLPKPGWTDHLGRTLSDTARERLTLLRNQLRELRTLTYLPIPELVTAAERVLGLDIEVIASVPGSVAHARRNLDAFATAAASFVSGVHDASVASFLAYLDAVEDEENGLDLMVAEPDPLAIQILTVHAAKGLEWDTVVVAGMNAGDFPSITPNKDGDYAATGWLTNARALPYSMRGDEQWLPPLPVAGAGNVPDVRDHITEFKALEGQRMLTEERRLAYVAMTRARHTLICTSHIWGTRKTPSTPSIFLQRLIDDGLADTGVPGHDWMAEAIHEENPRTQEQTVAIWPQPARQVAQAWERIWAESEGGDSRALIQTPQAQDWWDQAQLLLAERDEVRVAKVSRPGHLAASAMVELARDPEEFWRQRRRPIPRQPSTASRRGTRFHAWVEQYFGAQTLLDWDALPGADDSETDADLQALQEAFLSSPWAAKAPIAVEVDIETMLQDVAIRCRIDAVFAEGEGVHIVDWKTGASPRDAASSRAAQVQLSLYRLAWSRLHEVPVDQVQASLHYVSENRTIGAQDVTEAQLLALVQV